MTEHLTDVELTQEQEARAADLATAILWKGADRHLKAARLIVHLQDRVAELEREVTETEDEARKANVRVDQMAAEWMKQSERIAELERHLNKAEIERAWAIGKFREAQAEVTRLEDHIIARQPLKVTDMPTETTGEGQK